MGPNLQQNKQWIQHLPENVKVKSAVVVIITIITIVTYIYPIMILNVDISSLVNNIVHYFKLGTFSCHMQPSHLMERISKLTSVYKLNVQT